MRLFPSLLLLGSVLAAAPLSIETLFTRPYVWGTPPAGLVWAKTAPRLVFLWNESGRRFMDIYAYDAAAKKRVRLTALEFAKDPFNPAGDESDERLKSHRMPDAGLGSFAVSDDGKRVAYSWKGDLYLVPADGAGAPFRLTQTKAAESSPRFSPDGTKLAYSRGGDIFVQDLTTGAVVQAAEGGGAFQFSPDGKFIL